MIQSIQPVVGLYHPILVNAIPESFARSCWKRSFLLLRENDAKLFLFTLNREGHSVKFCSQERSQRWEEVNIVDSGAEGHRLACSSVNSEAHPALSLPRHLTNVLAIQANFDFSFLTPEVILTNTFLILPHLLPTLINISGLNLSVIFLGLPVSGLGPHTSALIVLKILCHCL